MYIYIYIKHHDQPLQPTRKKFWVCKMPQVSYNAVNVCFLFNRHVYVEVI